MAVPAPLATSCQSKYSKEALYNIIIAAKTCMHAGKLRLRARAKNFTRKRQPEFNVK